jgi:hypothetical protein
MTNKVKFRLKITGFELEMEGTKESTSLITSQVTHTLKGLMSPPSMDEKDAHVNGNGKNNTEDAEATVVSTSGRKRVRRNKSQNQNQTVTSDAIDFTHDLEKYGTPSIKWSTSTKSLWLLYVVKHSLNKDGMTTKQIIETFNKHFRQAKRITNVSRDLGALKVDPNMWVGEDTAKTPAEWYITESGEKQVQKMIADLKTQAQSNGLS